MWARHHAATRWCHVVAVDDSIVTSCRGRWPITDAYAVHEDPPLEERCGGCFESGGAGTKDSGASRSPASATPRRPEPDNAATTYGGVAQKSDRVAVVDVDVADCERSRSQLITGEVEHPVCNRVDAGETPAPVSFSRAATPYGILLDFELGDVE